MHLCVRCIPASRLILKANSTIAVPTNRLKDTGLAKTILPRSGSRRNFQDKLNSELKIHVWPAIWDDVDGGRCGSAPFPSLVRRGAAKRRGGLFKVAKHPYIIEQRSLLIGTFVFEQTAPALAARWHPRLTKAGNGKGHQKVEFHLRRGLISVKTSS
jgi:hypothetical protein